ncbi:ornithine--oxo-acid transaminase [Denitratisoma oestradiolicum]|uniref:Ornithine--oxo-acid aminotransferase n=1 Tax=Denitratisoma oestradiolicum TaxID=311182 RepID=A0A6S6XTT6_9PROT|nr:ornithine--oxo-acid transaminase [Denitratisoma oestradiolicum]TWO79059.1 ornithine--oxo-acid transaminase [Denitratisoma oestradiolicum]CAB1368190.1 conserved protein of unknown function [Denitratisoma oestradiolicum]
MDLNLQALRALGVASAQGIAHGRLGPGTAAAPTRLVQADLLSALRRGGLRARWRSAAAGGLLTPAPGSLLPELLADLAEAVEETLAAGQTPLVLGGDHSIAVGTWRGVARWCRQQNLTPGLIWVDAHLDAHTPATTPSGNCHGMPLAALLGEGGEWAGQVGAVLDPRRLCVVGAHSFEAEEAALLTRHGVRVFTLEEVRRRGLSKVWAEALAIAGTPFGVSLDLDALDSAQLPAVSTPAGPGLNLGELSAAWRGLLRQPGLLGLEIVEYDPGRDGDGTTLAALDSLLEAAALPDGTGLMTLEHSHGARNYAPLPVVLRGGEGCWLWDSAGHRYLDMMSAYSAVSLGHGHPRLVAALERQVRRLAVTSRAYYNERLPLLLERLCQLFGYERALPVNTGLEAVETALKAARKWAYQVKGVAPERAEIIACDGNFHGRSITIVGLSSEAQYREGFGPFPPGLRRVPYGDAAALEAAIGPDTAAFLVEPIQGEGGVVLPPAGYLEACAEICKRHHVLLICDEVQTGLGRTGAWLACQHEGVRPDGVILGKALGGGLLPVSAFLADRAVMDVFRPGDHGSTFGGNSLAATVALEALNVIEEEGLVERSARLGRHFLAGLQALDSPAIRQVRGRGLFIGVELVPEIDARTLCLRLLEAGILTKDTHQTVIRLAPPLVITEAQLDWALARIARVLGSR